MSGNGKSLVTDPREVAAEARRIALQGVGVLRKRLTQGSDGSQFVGIPPGFEEGWIIVRVWSRDEKGQIPVKGQAREASLRARHWQECPPSVQRAGDIRPGRSLYMWAPVELVDDENRARHDAIKARRDALARGFEGRVARLMGERGTGAEVALTRADHPRTTTVGDIAREAR